MPRGFGKARGLRSGVGRGGAAARSEAERAAAWPRSRKKARALRACARVRAHARAVKCAVREFGRTSGRKKEEGVLRPLSKLDPNELELPKEPRTSQKNPRVGGPPPKKTRGCVWV